jgi:AcrR family transcriptional regulator
MDRDTTKEPVLQQPRSVRLGRPARECSGQVDARILNAARDTFLQRGLGGASVDEIASLARAGKPTIYARFSGKEALFAAVVVREVAVGIGHVEAEMPQEGNIEERCSRIGFAILHWALSGGAIGLMRLAISEAHRFPDLASNVHRMARDRAAEAAAPLLGEAARSDDLGALPAFAPETLTVTTRIFLDLVVLPLLLRALFGQDHESLRADIEPHVASRVPFFLAACRSEVKPKADH